MNRKTMGIDVDGVCGDIITPWILGRYNRDYNDSLEYTDIVQWDLHEIVKPECGSKIYDYIEDPSLYNEVAPIEGVVDGLLYLRMLEYKIMFATHSTEGHMGRKYKWLLDYDLIKPEDEYIEGKDKSNLRADYLLDDYIVNVNSFKRQGVLFNQPWNRTSIFTPRCYGWAEVYRYFAKELN